MTQTPAKPPLVKGGKVLRWSLLGVTLIALIIVPFVLFESQISDGLETVFAVVRGRPVLGASLIIALLAGDCLLPVPSSIVSAFAGAAFSWAVGSVVIWTGMVLGCAIAYGLGASAGRVLALPVVGEGELARAQRLFSNIGPAALILTRGVPVLAEAGAMAAGAARMPFWSFMAATSLANAGIAVAYAATGALAASAHSFMLVFIGLIAVPAVGWGAYRLWTARRS